MAHDGNIKAVVFDLGGVIIDIYLNAAPDRWFQAVGGDRARIDEAYYGDTRYQLLERGQITMRDYYRHMLGRIGGELSFEDFLAGWNSVLGPVMPGIKPLLAELAGTLRLICLSNTNHCHAEMWRDYCADVLADFERVFVSHEMGVRKPEPASFQHVLDYLDVEPAQVAFIDDKSENVEAATRLGMNGIVSANPTQTAEGLRRLHVPIDLQP